MKRPAKSLLDEEEVEPATDAQLRVNQAYAARFEHNKQREELHRLQAKHPELAERLAAKRDGKPGALARVLDDDEESSSDSEDEDDGDIPDVTEARFLDTLLKIRRKDPNIYKPEAKFFPDEDEDEDGNEEQDVDAAGSRRKSKPLLLKDVLARQALEGAGDDSSSDDGGDRGAAAAAAAAARGKTHVQEQEELKRAFLSAAEEAVAGVVKEQDDDDAGEEFGEVLRPRKRARAAEQKGEEPDAAAAQQEVPRGNGRKKGKGQPDKPIGKLLDEYFGADGLDEGEQFLKSYILNKGWVDRSDELLPSYNDIVDEEDANDDKDEEFLERVDNFEAAYNFRFEEPGGASLVSHPRVIEGAVRKPDDRRKRERERKAAREAEAEQQRLNEVRRLKNLKKREIDDRLQKVRHQAGSAAPAEDLLDALLEGDFDPEEYDRRMAAAFDDSYYDAADDLDLEAHEDGNVVENESAGEGEEDEEETAAGFAALRKKLQHGLTTAPTADATDSDEEGGEDEEQGAEQQDLQQSAAERAKVQQLLSEYLKLDYEENIGGLQCRFKYKQVPAASFGLTPEDVLLLPDKELNQVVGLKKLAPYREDGHKKVRPNYKALQQLREEGKMAQDAADSSKRGRNRDRRHGGSHDKHHRDGGQRKGGTGRPDGLNIARGGVEKRPGHHAGDVKHRHKLGKGGKEGRAGGSDRNASAAAGSGETAEDAKKRARLESYARLTLKKPGKHGSAADAPKKAHVPPKQVEDEQQMGSAAAAAGDAQLTKAQRKNMKRALKRQAARADA